jgi:predicted RNase H-like HicB family nuclease
MARQVRLTAIIEREDEGFVSLCPELDIASQGSSLEEAQAKLVEALTLFFETAGPSEVSRRIHSEVFVTQFRLGRLRVLSGRKSAEFSNRTDSLKYANTAAIGSCKSGARIRRPLYPFPCTTPSGVARSQAS